MSQRLHETRRSIFYPTIYGRCGPETNFSVRSLVSCPRNSMSCYFGDRTLMLRFLGEGRPQRRPSYSRKNLPKRSCPGRFTSLRSRGSKLRGPISTKKRTHSWRLESQQQVSPCSAHLLLSARTCRNKELRCNVRYSSVQGLSASRLQDGRTGQREEQLCSGGQT
jgi:hypothetical protein